jgi:hypothetical protein
MRSALCNSTITLQMEREVTHSIPSEDITTLLDEWFQHLENPCPPPGTGKKVRKAFESLHKYFSDLEGALQTISNDSEKLNALGKATNPFDFATILELIIGEILLYEGKRDPMYEQVYYLYYFHRKQLEESARMQLFPNSAQIGGIFFASSETDTDQLTPEP